MQKSISAVVFSIADTPISVSWRRNAVQTSQVVGEGLRQERMLQELQHGVKNWGTVPNKNKIISQRVLEWLKGVHRD
jgi:hypothetical protein